MKIHRRKAALLAALLMAIGLAAMPLEGAAIVIRDQIRPPEIPGDPDGPSPGSSVKWGFVWLRGYHSPIVFPLRATNRETPSQTQRSAAQTSVARGRN